MKKLTRYITIAVTGLFSWPLVPVPLQKNWITNNN